LNAKLLVYCRTGVRSAQASAALAKIGYTQVYNMSGGITAWTYDTVSGS
jgi:rhodanese-related sulfurtransferase